MASCLLAVQDSMRKMSSRPFSLMEIMVVLILISIVGGVSAYSIIPFYKTYRFRSEVNALYDLVQELQLEALSLQSDMKIRFTSRQGKWSVHSLSDERMLKSQTLALSHVSKVDVENHLTITFYSNGLIEPKKHITLYHGEEKRVLDLSQPPLIKLWTETPQKPLAISNLNRLKPKERS